MNVRVHSTRFESFHRSSVRTKVDFSSERASILSQNSSRHSSWLSKRAIKDEMTAQRQKLDEKKDAIEILERIGTDKLKLLEKVLDEALARERAKKN